MTTITAIEREALQGILQGIVASDFNDANDPVGNWVWSFSANPWNNTPESKKFAGALSSLIKKGLAISRYEHGACVCITRTGMDALKG